MPTGIDRDGPARGASDHVLDDAFRGWQAGFRSDFVSEADHFTVQGDIFHNDVRHAAGRRR